MRSAAAVFLSAFAVTAGNTPAWAESAPATTDLELFLAADDTTVAPGQAIEVELELANTGTFGIERATVALPLPAELELIATEPADGYDPGTGEWRFGAVQAYDSVRVGMTLELAADADGAIALVADLASFEGAYGASDLDSVPGNDDPCEDDHAELILLAGEGDAGGPPDAGPDTCPDAGTEPPPATPDGGTSADRDGGTGADQTGGCHAAGGGAGAATALLVVTLAGPIRRCLAQESTGSVAIDGNGDGHC